MNARLLSAIGVLVLSTQVNAQSGYNVDIANPSSPSAPASSYGAASGQTGTWNACWPTGSPQSLVNISGANQGVTLTGEGGYPVLSYNDSSTSGGAESLLDDFHDTDAAAETATWTFAGLQPGEYQVYTYAMAPDGSAFTSSIDVLQSTSGPQTVGGSFSSGFVAGVTHAVHLATVTSNEQLTIEVTASSQYASISGFQIMFISGSPNDPPSQVTNPSPSNSATSVAVSTQTCWNNGGGASTYDVYFGTDSTPDASEFIGNQLGTCWNPPGNLSYSTTYYWRVDAKNSAGTTAGPVWSFTTGAAPPQPPSPATNPSPSNGASNVLITAAASWSNGGGATSYDVYFGTDSTPDSGEFIGNQASTSWDPPGNLANTTTYYWRIDAKNASGTTTGTVWSFTTQAPSGNPPLQATNPSPTNNATGVVLNTQVCWANGGGATSYDVYFGTDATPDSGESKGNISSTCWDPPGNLSAATTYYWRIDAKNSSGTTTGAVWSFTTHPATVTVSGQITLDGEALPGVAIDASNGGGSAVTDSNGNYTLSAIPYDWTGTVTPTLMGYEFAPTSLSFSDLVANVSGQNFDGSVSTTVVVFHGTVPEDQFGRIVAGVGDVDGDDIADFAIGSPLADNGAVHDSGVIRVYSGASLQLIGSPLIGFAEEDRFGSSIDAADVDGDGRNELLIGAPFVDADGMTDAGVAYLYSFNGTIWDLVHVETGLNAGDRFGYSVALADVTADGYADLIIGAPYNDDAAVDAGRVYVYSGTTFENLEKIKGQKKSDLFGYSVARIGKINSDSNDDFVVGAPNNDEGGSNAGKVYVYSGVNMGAPGSAVAVRTHKGATAKDSFGRVVRGVGKINGDSRDEYAVGAPYYNSGSKDDAGRVYVYSGTNGDVLWLKSGSNEGDRNGWSVDGGHDIDGDGAADLIVGPPLHDGAGENAGKAIIRNGINGSAISSQFAGQNAGDWFGHSVAMLDDIDGDGMAEMLVGAPRNDSMIFDAGAAYLFLSNNTGFGESNLPQPETNDEQELGDIDEQDVEDEPDTDGPDVESCVADVNNDGAVDIDDLQAVINSMGQINSMYDLTSDGVVDGDDITAVIAAWGACP